MMETVERSGEVVGFDNGLAKIRLERPSGCSGCGSRGTCASGSAAAQIVQMALPERTRLGDRVTVAMPSSSVALAAILGYLFPLIGLLLGAIAADSWYGGNLAAVVGAAAGFVVGLMLARLIAFFALGNGLSDAHCQPGLQPDLPPGEHS